MRFEQPITIIGLPGAGKSTIGRRVANALDLQFYDSDQIIENRAKCSIANYFKRHGEIAFREIESTVLADLLKKNMAIYSTGGGIVLDEQNRRLLKQKSTAIYLEASAETLYKRLRHDTTRPLLQVDNPLAKLQQLKDERDSSYKECATITINVDKRAASQIVEEILQQLLSL